MDDFFQANFEAFPAYETIYAKFEPIEPSDNSTFFEVELPRDESQICQFLRKLRPYNNLDDMTPLKVIAFARELLSRNLHNCYCSGQNLHDIISLYKDSVITPEKEFPGAGEGERSEVYHDLYPGVPQAFITENVKIPKDRMLDGKLIRSGSTIKFFYQGPIE